MTTQVHAHPTPSGSTTLKGREVLGNPEYVRIPRAGERLMGISRSQLYKLIGEGKVKSKAVGRMRLIHIPSLVTFIESAD